MLASSDDSLGRREPLPVDSASPELRLSTVMVAPAVSDDGTNLIKLLSTLDFKHLGTNGWSPRRQLARIANWREALREACDMIGLSGIRANPSGPTLAKVVELNPTFTVVEAC